MPPNYTRKNGFLELGSTTIKLYVVPPGGEHAGEVEREIKVPWDLGYDVFEKGRISPGTVSHCLRTLREFQQQFPEIPFETVAAVGTAALREAQNAEVLQRILWEDLRLKIQIIEGGIEAFLLETGFRSMVEAYPTALFDLGGGSLELIEYLTHASTRKTSIPVGAIRLHCQLRRTRDMCEYVREGRRKVASALREHLSDQLMAYDTLLGTGGTVRAITRCAGREEFEIGEIQDLIQREIHGPIWHDLDPHRRKLLLPGLIAVEGLFTTLGVERILYRKASVKRGLLSLSGLLQPAG